MDAGGLRRARLHGPVEHLLLEDDTLYAATALERHLAWDMGDFYADRCALLRPQTEVGRCSHDLAERWWESLSAVRFLERVDCTHAHVKAAMTYFAQKDFHKLSLVDATSFVLMRKHRLRVAFTFDAHFAAAGFRLA